MRVKQATLCADLPEYAAQLVEIDRLAQMKIEAGLFAAPDVLVAVEASQRHAFDGLFLFSL